jgi:hypothetical protein
MEHGGVLLKPPVAIPTLDLHAHDQKFVKPVQQEFSLETDGTYTLKERIEDKSRKGSKKISTFRKNSTETGCNPEMEGSFWPKMLLNFRKAVIDNIFPTYVNNANVSFSPSNTENDWLVHSTFPITEIENSVFFYFVYFPKLIFHYKSFFHYS